MPYVRKIDPTWQPSEHPGLKVGDVCIITDPNVLVKEGYVEVISNEDVEKARRYVEKKDEETSDLTCDECGKQAKSKAGLASHKRSHN